ncbi:hypothetical protein ACWGRN_29925 [Streptomyces albidoflavus]
MSLSQLADTSIADSRLRDRFAALGVLWKLSALPRTRGCQRVGTQAAGSASLVAGGLGNERTSGFSGLASCGSVWACPYCAEKILAGRKEELNDALGRHVALGGKVAMVTLTMRHRDGQALADLWNGVSKAWGAATSGRGWEAGHAQFGSVMARQITKGARKGEWVMEPRIGFVRVAEVTHGANGWHVHVHAALFLGGHVTADDVDNLGRSMFQDWRAALLENGFDAPIANSGGLDAKLWEFGSKDDRLSKYLTKNAYCSTVEKAALELARPDLKSARGGNRTPFEILAEIVDRSLGTRDLALWHEWERASKGRRQMTWSTGLRTWLRFGPELTDQQLAEDAIDGEILAVVEREGLVVLAELKLHAELRIAARSDDDGSAARRFLTEHRIAWRHPYPEEVREYHRRTAHRPADPVGPPPWQHLVDGLTLF